MKWHGVRHVSAELDTKLILPENSVASKAFSYPLGESFGPGDTTDRPYQSSLKLFEDGNLFGIAHSLHHEIRSIGKGNYSHWGNQLLFSSSDNSDPRENGRNYRVDASISCPHKNLTGIILLCLGFLIIAYSWNCNLPDVILLLLGIIIAIGTISLYDVFKVRKQMDKDLISVKRLSQIAYSYPMTIYQGPFLYAPTGSVEFVSSDNKKNQVPTDDFKLYERVRIYVDGKPLSSHEDTLNEFMTLGMGRYHYKDSELVFSMPSNEDPRCIDRIIEIEFPVRLSQNFLVFLSFIFVVVVIIGKTNIKCFYDLTIMGLIARCCIILPFLTGMLLILINIFGLVIPLRNPNIYRLPPAQKLVKGGDIIHYSEAASKLVRSKSESDLEYAIRANDTVHRGVAHYWDEEGIDEFRIRVPYWENWILNVMAYTGKSKYFKYQFSNHYKGLERGVGLCGQKAMILTGFLIENGIDARILSIPGHTMVVAHLQRSWQIFDPDYGVHIPHDLAKVKDANLPDFVMPYYEEAVSLYNLDPETMNDSLTLIEEAYKKKQFSMDQKGFFEYIGGEAVADFETLSYLLKHLVPIIMMLPLPIWLSARVFQIRQIKKCA